MLNRQLDPTQPHRYVRYGRMSHEKQNPRSPEQQFETIDRLLGQLRYPWVHVKDYRDDAVSGRYLKKRQGYQQMLADVRSGALGVDLILVDSAERFGRVDELTAIRAELQNRHGVLVLTADSRFTDPTTPQGRALVMVETIRATEDGRIKAHNVLRGLRDAARQGHWPGGRAPFGFKLKSVVVERDGRVEVSHNTLARDPETDWIVVKAFALARATGWGRWRLTRALNEDPEVPARFKPFHESTVESWLRNPIYHGELLWARHATGIIDDTRVTQRNAEEDVLRVPGFCDPLVPKQSWDEVAALRAARSEAAARYQDAEDSGKQIRPLAPGVALSYLLSGLVRCGVCGRAMRIRRSGVKNKAGKKYLYYCCLGAMSGVCTNRRRVREDSLRAAVVSRLRARLFAPPAAEQESKP